MPTREHTDWSGQDGYEDPSRITYDVRAWAARRLRAGLAMVSHKPDGSIDIPAAGTAAREHTVGILVYETARGNGLAPSDLLDAVLAEPGKFLQWVDDNEYRGEGYSCGHWIIDWSHAFFAVVDHGRALAVAAVRARDLANIHSLDDWLHADIAGTLVFPGEQGGSRLLSRAVKAKLARAAWRRQLRLRRQTERVCACGVTFMPSRCNSVRCDACRARRQEQRQEQRQEPSRSRHRKEQ